MKAALPPLERREAGEHGLVQRACGAELDGQLEIKDAPTR